MDPEIHLTKEDIQSWVGPSSFQKGQSYYNQNMIFEPGQEGQTLLANCHGSQGGPYSVRATLGPQGVILAGCSCPVGEGGRCKHVAALLLTWLDDPESFEIVKPLTDLLEKRSKAELIQLLRLMIEREPDLRILLEMPLPGGNDLHKPLDRHVIHKQVEHAFRTGDYDEWPDSRVIDRDLRPLFNLAAELEGQEQFENAAVIYLEIAQELLHYTQLIMGDESGHTASLLSQAVEGMGACLEGISDTERRAEVLRTSFDVYALDVLHTGGSGISDPVPGIWIEQATPAEVQQIVRWIRDIMPRGDTWSDNYHRQVLGGMLLDLQEQNLDDDAFLALCRQTGRVADLVDRLLTLGRIAEAVREARQAEAYDLPRLADIFVHHEQGDLARNILEERALVSKDIRLRDWLKEYARKLGDLPAALEQALQIHAIRPSVEAYTEVRSFAEKLDRWPPLRDSLLKSLEKAGQYRLITEIYLFEGQASLALAALEKLQASSNYLDISLINQVAQAAQVQQPRESIRLYLMICERLIANRGRGNYIQAVEYLKQVRDLYQRLSEAATWKRLVADLRLQNRSLRALQEELNRAGLE